jgi:hypothetical protein
VSDIFFIVFIYFADQLVFLPHRFEPIKINADCPTLVEWVPNVVREEVATGAEMVIVVD